MNKNNDIFVKIQKEINSEIDIVESERIKLKSGVSICMNDMYCGGLRRAIMIVAKIEDDMRQ